MYKQLAIRKNKGELILRNGNADQIKDYLLGKKIVIGNKCLAARVLSNSLIHQSRFSKCVDKIRDIQNSCGADGILLFLSDQQTDPFPLIKSLSPQQRQQLIRYLKGALHRGEITFEGSLKLNKKSGYSSISKDLEMIQSIASFPSFLSTINGVPIPFTPFISLKNHQIFKTNTLNLLESDNKRDNWKDFLSHRLYIGNDVINFAFNGVQNSDITGQMVLDKVSHKQLEQTLSDELLQDLKCAALLQFGTQSFLGSVYLLFHKSGFKVGSIKHGVSTTIKGDAQQVITEGECHILSSHINNTSKYEPDDIILRLNVRSIVDFSEHRIEEDKGYLNGVKESFQFDIIQNEMGD